MSTATDALPLEETLTPDDPAALAEVVRAAADVRRAVYPIGGGTSLGFGLPATVPGLGISLAGLTRVVDYPARDMTITVEAGISMSTLTQTMAAERQHLPIDVPFADRATLGGVIATNWSGPRRLGSGTIRDYVIGISAVDGRGIAFKGGGRVVKNVAGYDFCKLLIGSLGTLAIVTQVTLKTRPLPQTSTWIICDLPTLDLAERLLADAVALPAMPAALELVAGPRWRDHPLGGQGNGQSVGQLALALEGTEAEVSWLAGEVIRRWQDAAARQPLQVSHEESGAVLRRLTDSPATTDLPGEWPTTLKFSLPPSAVVGMVGKILASFPSASVQAHAASGIVWVQLYDVAPHLLARKVVQQWQSAARAVGGAVVLTSHPQSSELTRHVVWGPSRDDWTVMATVKRQFDPYGVLNPGRFIFPAS